MGWRPNLRADFEFVWFSYSPLHLAIIHQQTGVIQQLIQTLLSSQQQNILNTANHLLQVQPANPMLTSTGLTSLQWHLIPLDGKQACLSFCKSNILWREANSLVLNLQPVTLATVLVDGSVTLVILAGRLVARKTKSAHSHATGLLKLTRQRSGG